MSSKLVWSTYQVLGQPEYIDVSTNTHLNFEKAIGLHELSEIPQDPKHLWTLVANVAILYVVTQQHSQDVQGHAVKTEMPTTPESSHSAFSWPSLCLPTSLPPLPLTSANLLARLLFVFFLECTQLFFP